ncbi:uncharacterized protein [Dendrobates tinctorius]|uniref:uncharacterized protein n=1 Tax=Dendrobates tinctorius TaxID=92724 RepID=UPI003CC98505
MESLRSVVASMEKGEFLASIDIKDAYLPIPICPSHQHFLHFAIHEEHFQFVALPFGLATASRVTTKVMTAVMAILHSRGVVVLPYLDDLLIKGPSLPACKESVDVTVNTLSRLGWQINFKKSFPKPAEQITFLGMILNTSRGLVILPPEKTQALQQTARTFSRPTSHTIRFSMRVLGKMVAAIEAVPFAQLHLRPLQHALLLAWDKNLFSLDRRFLLSVPAGHISPQVVDTEVLPESREVFSPSKMVGSNHRRKSSRLGCGLSPPHGTGSLVNSRVTSPHRHFGDTSDQISSMEFPPSPRRSPHQDPI